MISIHPNVVKRLIDSISCDFDQKEALQKIKNLKIQFKGEEEEKIIEYIIDEFETKKKDFIKISLSEIEEVKNRIGIVKNKGLKNAIITILDYKGKRGSYFPKVFRKVGIKTCVYCNAQSTLTIEKSKGGGLSARYQLDHYYPKKDYPYLSIAIFNLYPVCASCNLTKGTKDYDFELYKEQTEPSPFKFELDKASKAHFLVSRSCKDLIIKFQNIQNKNFKDILDINGIYNGHQDIAEEIILKRLAYNEEYRKTLNKLCKKHKITKPMIKRFILGNYTEEREIHKRPLAKFMQDIGKEVGLIE